MMKPEKSLLTPVKFFFLFLVAFTLFFTAWVDPAICGEPSAANSPFTKGAKVTLHPVTKIPRKVVGINIFPSALKEGAVPLTEKNAETVFKGFLAENIKFFRVNPENLKLISINKRKENWYVKFQQYYKGIAVYNATVGFSTTERGMIRTYGSSYYPDLEVPTTPKISLQEAVKIARNTYDPKIGEVLTEKEALMIIYPEKTETGVVFHLAWKFLLSGKRPNPEVDKYFIIDAITGKILKSYLSRFPGANAYGKVEGEIHPVNPTNPPVSTGPLSHGYVDVERFWWDRRTTTDSDGNWKVKLPSWFLFFSKYDATSSLEGPYARVQDSNGLDYTLSRECRKNRTCNLTWTATDRDHINVFYHMNLLHGWYKNRLNYNWVNAWDGTSQFHAEVNHSFNNAYAGDPILFGTDDFAQSSDVIYHECTHNVLYALYGDYIGWPNANSEGYAFDEGFADYFAASLTEDPVHGEGYGGTRTLDNNRQYPGKSAYNIEGHTGGMIIGGAAWDLRGLMMGRLGDDAGSEYTDDLIFEAHQVMSTLPRDYYFSDPQESNFLVSLYMAADDNNNLNDGVPYFFDIQGAFANHNLLQAVLFNKNSYDVSTNTVGNLTGGDFYYSGGSFWANNVGQRGVVDLGDIGAVPLDQVNIPTQGYSRFGVAAATGHTYVSLAQQGEEGNYIAFRVTSMSADSNEVVIEYLYRAPLRIDPFDLCRRYPFLCEMIYPCKKYPFLCEPYVTLPGKDSIILRFRHELDRVVIPIEKICLYVLNCPGCGPFGLCPGYDISFIDMPDTFGIDIYNSKGITVFSDLSTLRNKRIKLRPVKGETYFLVISPSKETKIGVEYELPLKVQAIAR